MSVAAWRSAWQTLWQSIWLASAGNVLDFATLTPAALASRLSWVRTGAGTMEESGGDVRYGAHNLLPYSSDFTNAAWTKSDCSVSGQVVTKTAASPWLYQVAATATGQSYVTWFDVEAGTATSCKIFCINQGVAVYEATFDLIAGTVSAVTVGSAATIIGLGGGVFRCTLQRVHTIGAANDIFGLTVLGSQGDSLTVHRGQLNLGPVALDYVPTTTAPVYLMRTPDYSFGVPGLLLEGQRTQMLLDTENFQGAAWALDSGGATNPVVTPNYGTAPNGTLTADRIVFNRTGGTFSRIRQGSVTASGIYTFSVWLKTTGGSANVGLRLDTTGINCAVTSAWQRFSVSLPSAAANVDSQILLFSSIPGNDVTADVLAWGAQLEAGAYPTSYIPNPGTDTVTRAADVAEIGPGAEFDSLFPAAQGTIVVEWCDLGAADTDLLSLHLSGSTSESMILGWSAAQVALFSIAGGVLQPVLYLGAATARSLNKVAFSWGPLGISAVLNAGAVQAASSAVVPAPTHARLAGAGLFNSHHTWKPTKITTLPTQTTGAALQALTV